MVSPVQQIESLYQRLEKARQLVANGKVHPVIGQEAHHVVQASKGGFYLVNGTCTCPDAQQRDDVHKGWCKHKLAVEVLKAAPADAEKPKSGKRAKSAATTADESDRLEREIAELYH